MLRFTLWCFLCLAAWPSTGANLLLIIDDMGNNLALGQRALALGQGINYAFLPHTPQAAVLAEQAHQQGQGILLHAPMESSRKLRLGPGGLYPEMSKQEIQHSLQDSLASIPYVQGMNNHMGSLLTTEQAHMDWVMEVVQQHDIFFVDSFTTAQSVAFNTAQDLGIPSLKRDVFLDNELSQEALERQFAQAVRMAKEQGYAVLIGHPYPETLEFLEQRLPSLAGHHIQLTRVTDFLHARNYRLAARVPAVKSSVKPAYSTEPSVR